MVVGSEGGCWKGVIFVEQMGGGCVRGRERGRGNRGRCERGWLHEGSDDKKGDGDDE